MKIFNQIALYTYIIVSILACGATYIYVTVGLGGDTFGGIVWALICGVFMGLLYKCAQWFYHDVYPLIGNNKSKDHAPDTEKSLDGQSNQTDAGEQTDTRKQHDYFSMKLLSLIHEACNGKQFEEISAQSFYNCMNLITCEDRLKFKPGEKARVCYIVSLMCERLPKQDKDNWRTGILKRLEIDDNFYAKKYKAPVSDDSSEKDKIFAEEMDEIFR